MPTSLGTAGLGTAGLGTAGLGTAGLGTAGLGTAGKAAAAADWGVAAAGPERSSAGARRACERTRGHLWRKGPGPGRSVPASPLRAEAGMAAEGRRQARLRHARQTAAGRARGCDMTAAPSPPASSGLGPLAPARPRQPLLGPARRGHRPADCPRAASRACPAGGRAPPRPRPARAGGARRPSASRGPGRARAQQPPVRGHRP